jgi:predicted enzyme related to lactoylglutathione lyase
MPRREHYEPGTPMWVDLSTSDPDAAKAFYRELFGWEAEDAGPPEETGGYGFFNLRGEMVAGVGPLQDPSSPSAWGTFISTPDVDATAGKATEAGAQVVAGPMDVMDAGRMVMLAHPAGGIVGGWQEGRHTGAKLVNEPGSFGWSELQTHDVEGAKAFGAAVFGWDMRDMELAGGSYAIVHVGERPVAGITTMGAGTPDELPAFWLTYFEVDDCDAVVAKAGELGGVVQMPPQSAEGVGRFAILADPQGAAFGVIASQAPDE